MCHGVPVPSSGPADVVLNPAVRVLWRGPRAVQLELGGRAVVVDGIDAHGMRNLLGRGDAPMRRSDRAALRSLAESGFLWPGRPVEDDPRLAPPRPRLAPDLGALAARYGDRAAELLSARRAAAVAVHGTGRVAGQVAALLAAAGVGRVYVTADSDARLPDAAPGGITPADEGRRFGTAVADAINRAAPEAEPTAPPNGQQPDLVVLALSGPVDPDRRAALHVWRHRHLAVQVGAGHGVVGPLVIPGLTSCLRCADLHRLDRDPAWSALAVQLALRQRRGDSTDVALATTISGMTALQALAFLDGGEPAVIDGTLELHLPDWRVRRRSWPVHPSCDCGGPLPDRPAALRS